MNQSVQYPLFHIVDTTADEDFTIHLPPNSLVLGGGFVSVTTVAAGTTPVLDIDDNSVSPIAYANALAADALGDTAISSTATGVFYPAGATLSGVFSGADHAGGRFLIVIPYVVVGRLNEKPYGAS